ncbi:hypothetical protein FOZ63_004686, partial [Perkinsus olseni]
MRIASGFSLAPLIGATTSLSDTIVSIKSGPDAIDIRHLPHMLREVGHIPDQKIASFLSTAKVTTLKHVGSQVVQTSALTIDSHNLCNFVTTASKNLSLQSQCGKDGNAEPFGELDSELNVNDPDVGCQHHLTMMQMGEVWRLAIQHATRRVKVAVIDSGIDWNDPDFAPLRRTLKTKSGGYVPGGWNVFGNSPFMTTRNNHGAAICRVLVAKANNSYGFAGVAPNVTLVPIQFVDDNYDAPLSKFLEAIDLAIDLEVDVISMSFGFQLSTLSSENRHLLWEALRLAQEKNIVLVSAAGNSNMRASDIFPCWYGGPNGMCVANLQTETHLNLKSNWGERVDVAAYGTNICIGRDEEGVMINKGGSSLAGPMVAGLAAILLSMDVEPRMVKRMILSNVDPVASYNGQMIR